MLKQDLQYRTCVSFTKIQLNWFYSLFYLTYKDLSHDVMKVQELKNYLEN